MTQEQKDKLRAIAVLYLQWWNVEKNGSTFDAFDEWNETEQGKGLITALFRPEWKPYPEERPTEGGTHRVTVRAPSGFLQSSFDGWDGVNWETFDDNEYFTVIAFAELGDVEPYNPEKP